MADDKLYEVPVYIQMYASDEEDAMDKIEEGVSLLRDKFDIPDYAIVEEDVRLLGPIPGGV